MGDDRAMNRPRAANAALQAAKGEWLIFLDDDDLWTPDHVQRLVNAAQANGQVRAVHSDVQVVDQDGRELTRYDRPWLPQRMAFTNVLPIHSVLFDASLVREHGCSFDESMPVLEDWDFWLQVTRHTDVLHVPGVSAIYRYRDRSGLNSVDGAHQHRVWRDHVLGRWLQRFTERQTIDAIAWYTRCLDEEQQRARAAHLRAIELEERLQLFTAEAGAQSAGLQAALRDTQAELTAAGQALHSRAAQASQAEDRCAQLEAQLRDVKSELQAAGQRLEHAVLAATAAHEVKLVLENLNRTFQTELGAAQADWRQERKVLQAKVDQLDRQCRDLQDQCAEQAQTIAEIHRSSSWQVTRPWRWLGRILGRR
jgi:hypothetical protein